VYRARCASRISDYGLSLWLVASSLKKLHRKEQSMRFSISSIQSQTILAGVISALLFPTLCKADNSLGVELGANFSSISFNPGLVNNSTPSGTTQFLIGALADWGLQDIWYLETELRYNSYGTSIATTTGGSTTTLTETASYLEVPILIKAKFNMGQFFPYVMAGPNFALKISENLASNGTSFTPLFGSAFRSPNLSLDLGAGAEVPFAPGFSGFAQIRYSFGITNIDTNNNPTEVSGTTYRTGGFQIALGAMMPF
jgi:hypothetical protein